MSNIFSDLDFKYDILTLGQFEKSISEDDSSLYSQSLNIDKSFEKIKENSKQEIKTVDTKKGTGILKTSTVKSNNNFLNIVQDKETKKREAEEKKLKSTSIEFPYIRTPLLTNAEMQLYHFMINNLDYAGKVVIFPKVRLGDLITLDTRITMDKSYLYKVTSKHVDFLICKYDTLDIICVVELDDYTHDNDESRKKDLFIMEALYNVGIDVVRIKVPIKTICKADLEFLDEKINTVLAPTCAECGAKMVPKKSMNKSNRGHRFFSCPNFINGCRHTINIDQTGEKLP